MPFYATAGGSILEIDLPADPMRLEIHEAAIARGDLVEVDEALVEQYVDGPGVKFRLIAAEPEADDSFSEEGAIAEPEADVEQSEPEPAAKKPRKGSVED